MPLTLPSHASILTGLPPTSHGLHGNGHGALATAVPTLAARLAAAGYRTGAFVGAFVLDERFGLGRGFEVYDDEIERGAVASLEAERPGREVVDHALAWMEQDTSRPFFAWVHLYDAHAPYTPPEPHASHHRDRPYDGEIAAVDEQVGRLLTSLASRGLVERTVVVVTADHGEGLGEHGELTHGLLLYESTLRVPLLLRAPGVLPAGQRISAALSLVDLAPTLAGLLSIPFFDTAPEPTALRGRDLGAELVAGTPPRELEIYAETRYPESFGWSPLAALRRGRLKYIEAPRPELYDLASDPGETKNRLLDQASAPLAGEGTGFAARLSELVSSRVSRPPPEVDSATRARLAALGYVSPPAAVAARADGTRRDPKDAVALFHGFEQAHWHRLAGRHEEAANLLTRLVAEDPANSVFRAELAAAHRAAGQLDRALPLLREAVALAPRDPDAWYNLATALSERGFYDEALEALRGALEHDPGRPEAHNALGIAYAALGRLDQARQVLERAVALDAGNARAWNNLGNVCRDLGRTEQAIQSYERAMAADPSYADPWNGRGTLEAARDRPREALSFLDQALKLNPELAEVRFNRAIALEMSGERAAAEAAYRDFLARSADDPSFAQQRTAARQLLARLVKGSGESRGEGERR